MNRNAVTEDAKRQGTTPISRHLLRFMLGNPLTQRVLLKRIEGNLRRVLVEINSEDRPRRVQEAKLAYMLALLHGLGRSLRKGFLSRAAQEQILDVFLGQVVRSDEETQRLARHLGFEPPLFLVISPTGRCNLRCAGCYAASDPGRHASLSRSVFERLLDEKRRLWDSHFTVISGGEPLLWRDDGCDLLDIVGRHPDQYFLMYTNATLLDDAAAQRLAQLGNLTPALSVEGFETETDARRGPGVYARLLQAAERLRRHGVPFGISVTPTRRNWEVITSDRFIDFWTEEQGAVYIWSFQYMPIGRQPSLDLMVPPEARVEMLRRTQRLVHERKVFFADFWNSGVSSSGCISAGRPGGYFYIDWNGDITPCVFVPYAVDNIYRLYERGGTISDILAAPFFQRIRQWQDDYGYRRPAAEVDNWLCPCAIRDHFDMLHRAAVETGARPISPEAAAALADPGFYEGLTGYARAVDAMTRPIWEAEYAEQAAPEAARAAS